MYTVSANESFTGHLLSVLLSRGVVHGYQVYNVGAGEAVDRKCVHTSTECSRPRPRGKGRLKALEVTARLFSEPGSQTPERFHMKAPSDSDRSQTDKYKKKSRMLQPKYPTYVRFRSHIFLCCI